MRQLMRQHGLPEPIFQEIGQTCRVTFTGPGNRILDLIPEAGVTDLCALGLNDRQVQALALMVNEGGAQLPSQALDQALAAWFKVG